jgi:tetratricopeptide (TPR) repeat protein
LSGSAAAERWLERVAALLEADRQDEARRLLFAELDNPRSTEIGYAYYALLAEPSIDQALKAACRQRARACKQTGAAGHALGGVALMSEADFGQALEHLNRALELSPDDPAVLSLRSAAHSGADDMTASLADAKRAFEIDPTRWLAALGAGDALRLGGSLEEAARYLRAGLQHRPRQPLLLTALGGVLLAQNALPEAIEVIERAIEVNGSVAHLWNNLAHARFETGDLAAAEEAIEKTLELDPQLQEGVYMRCLIRSQQGRLDAARRDLAWLQEVDASARLIRRAEQGLRHAEALQGGSQLAIEQLLLQGQRDEARRLMHALLDEPQSTEAVYRLSGLIAVGLLDPEWVAECVERGRRCQSAGAAGEALRAIAHYVGGDGPRGLALLENAVEGRTDDVALLCMRGGLRVNVAADLPGGLADAERALALDPRFGKAWRLLGSLRARAGDSEGALEAARRAVALEGGDPFSWASMGLMLRRSGRLPEATQAFQRAIEIYPHSTGLWVGLGEIQGLAGDAQGVLESVDRALALPPGRWSAQARRLRCVALAWQGDLEGASAELEGLRQLDLSPEDLAAAEAEVTKLRRRRQSGER